MFGIFFAYCVGHKIQKKKVLRRDTICILRIPILKCLMSDYVNSPVKSRME